MRRFVYGIAFVLAAAPAAAEPPPEDVWEFSIMPYGWINAIEGEVGDSDFVYSYDRNIDEVFDSDWEPGYGLMLDGRWRRLVVTSDLSYNHFSTNENFPGFRLDTDQTHWIGDLKIGARLYDESVPWADADTDPRRLKVDLLAGARYWNVRSELTTDGSMNEKFDATIDWVDPLVGARASMHLTDMVSLTASGDVGGFGAFNGSDVTWTALGLVNIQPWERVSFHAGYKWLRADRDDTDFDLSGPLVGVGFHF